MNKIGIYNQTEDEVQELATVEKLLNYAVSYEKLDNVEFNVIIVDNQEIHQLNRECRGINRPTDVITFALEDNTDFPDLDIRILGDIYISLDKAKGQALEYGHSFLRELSFLAVHGFLHLLGYDHMEENDEKIMFDKQEEILNGFGIKR
ncbi:MAG: rRNA maturation RNase YbeY [Bacilli bacterium]